MSKTQDKTGTNKWRGISIPEPIAAELERLGNDPRIQSTYGVNGIPEIVRRACTMLIKEWRAELRDETNGLQEGDRVRVSKDTPARVAGRSGTVIRVNRNYDVLLSGDGHKKSFKDDEIEAIGRDKK